MKKEIENKFRSIIKNFNFFQLKQELDNSNLSNTEKIIILKSAILECNLSGIEDDEYWQFIRECSLLSDHLNDIQNLQKKENNPKESHRVLKISTKTGAKINLIRILNAIHELNLISDENDRFLTKKDFMKLIGDFFGEDLSSYSTNLSKAMHENTLEANIEVFQKMIKKTTMEHYEILKNKSK